MGTRVYINVAVMGSVEEVLGKILKRLHDNGLYEYAEHISLVVNGDIDILQAHRSYDKIKVYHTGNTTSLHEFPTLKLIFDECKTEEEFNILYLHTKGVSRNHQFVNDWVEMLSYFNIDRWRERIDELEHNDCTGVNLKGNPDDINSHPMHWGYGKAPKHYSGNFWWAKSSHVKSLTDPTAWLPDNNLDRWRMMNEMWICSKKDGLYHNAHSSDVDHYHSPYPKEIYQND